MSTLLWLLTEAGLVLCWLVTPWAPAPWLALCWLMAPLAGWLALLLTRKRWQVRLTCPVTAEKGKPFSVTAEVRQGVPFGRGRLTVSVENTVTGETHREKLTLHQGRGAWQVQRACCGCLVMQAAELVLWDLLGVLPVRIPCTVQGRICVMPDTFPIEADPVSAVSRQTDCEEYAPDVRGSDPTEIFQIREYVPGDSLRQIHWKLSQKTDSLMVRELGLPVAEEVLLLLDTSTTGKEDAADALDAAMTALLSLSRSLTEQGIAHSVGWKNRELEELSLCTVRDQQDCTAVREQILTASAAPDAESICDCFRKWSGDVYAHTVVCAPSLPRGLSLLQAGNRVTVLLSDGGAQSCDGVMVIPFSRKNMAQELEYLEI